MLKISQLTEDRQKVAGLCCLVSSADLRLTKTGKPYLAGVLMDDTGTIGFKVWDNAELLKEVLSAGLPVTVKSGVCEEYNGEISVKVTVVEALPPAAADDLLLKSHIPFDVLMEKWNNYVSRLKEMGIDLTAGIERLASAGLLAKFFKVPAAVKHHHVFRHGLLQHTLEVCDIADSLIQNAAHYQNLDLDPGVIFPAAMFHDFGKLAEYDITPLEMFEKFSLDGEMLGHHYIGAVLFEKVFGKAFAEHPDRLRGIKHCILSHHGKLEWGACLVPRTPEAYTVSQADLYSAQIGQVKTGK